MTMFSYKQRHVRAAVLSSLVLFFVFIAMSASLFSQTAATGGLTGTVKDSSGAVVPNATVTATNIGTSQSRTTVTTAEGSYKFGFLAPGSYKVRFEAAGFSAAEVPSVTVNVTETPVLDQTLSVGGQTQQVEVVGQAEAVQTATSTVGTVVNSKVMTEMPLTSRNYTNLLGLSAGAQTGVFNAANLGRGSQDISVNGSTSVQNNYSMDGASIVNATTNGKTADAGANAGIGIVNPDAIQEFKIQTSLYDAGYGRNPGANVNVVTKSGTNQFHGTAFEFFRNTSLNANEYFRKQSLAPNNTKQRLDQHQFGGTIGGPVKKDKLFFFTSFQETRQKNGIAPAGYSNPTLPGIPNIDRSNTAAFRTALGAAFCPTGTANAGTTGRTQQGGTQVACNGSNINPIAMNLLQLKNPDGSYYIPGSTTGSNQNATFSIPAIYAEHQAIGNFDYLLNNSNTLSGRWSYSGNRTDASMGCAATGTAISQCLPGNPGQVWFQTQYSVLKLTSILTNNVVNEGRFSVQRVVSELSNGVPFTNSQVGISSIVPSIDTLDTFTITGLVAFGGRANLSTVQKVTSWQAADQISWSHGKHTTRAGFEYGRDRQNWPNPGVAIGTLTFSTFQDFLIGLPGCATVNAACATSAAAGQTNGSAFSNIANTGNTTSIIPPEGLIHHYRISSSNAFLQDDYKVFSNLTLNLGIRWEYNGLARDNAGALTTIWPSLINTVPVPGTSAATGTLAGYVVPSNFNFAAYPAPPVGGLYQNNKDIATQNSPSIKNFAPRAGFAWKPLSSDRFVIRGGGGYFYDRIGSTVYNKGTQQNTPYAVPIARSGAANFASSLAQPYDPTARLGWTPRWANLATGASSNLSVTLTNPIILTPTTYEWNLNMQYEFLPKWVLEVGYVGTRGIHQAPDSTIINILEHQLNSARLASPTNPINGITTNTNANAALRVPYLGFGPGGLGSALNIGDSKYNSLQATVRKQFSHGLQMQAAYTYGRALNTSSYLSFNDANTPTGYGLNPSYRSQRLALNYSWDLPLGKHEGFLGKAVNGWSLAGVTVLQNGSALTVTDSRGGTIYGFGSGTNITSTAQYAVGKGNADVATPGDVKQRLGGLSGGVGYLDRSAFGTVPAIGNGTGYGNSGFGSVLGPGQVNFDTTLQKITQVGGIREDANLVFRAEFFNLFNHAQFSNPTGAQLDVSRPTFGQITSTAVNPRLIQFALKYVF